MNKTMSILLLLMLNGICWANLLKNPSFEVQQEQNSSMPEFWSVIKKGTFEESNALEEKIVFAGKRAVSIRNENPALQKADTAWNTPHRIARPGPYVGQKCMANVTAPPN